MKNLHALCSLCAALLLGGCATTKLYDLKNDNLSAPAQNTVRVCNTLTWIYNTSLNYTDMSELLKEIGITRQELETLQFKGTYEKPFGRQFSMSADSSDDEKQIYSKAKKQAQKIARLMLKKLPPEGGNSTE
ncbi:MAG: hypothetical protein J6X95_04090 [Treponema sp.]|nr:hypothetical protein [Treponema sp.]